MSGGVVVSQLGARMHYAVPRILHASGDLEHLYTDVCATQGWPRLLTLVPGRLRPPSLQRLAGRIPHEIAPEQITTFPGWGLAFTARRMAARTPGESTAAALWAGSTFSRMIARRGFRGGGGLYAFSGESLEQLRAARAAGLWTVVEQIIAPRTILDRLLAEEEQAFPDWQPPMAADPYGAAFAERERQEWATADLIVCGSDFVRDGLIAEGVPEHRIAVVPYGVDAGFRVRARKAHGGPLRVLTVGAVGLRKGSPYVLEAARRLKGRAVFRMVGPCEILPEARQRLQAAVEIAGIVPRAEIGAHLAWADVFLLPSICEGSATAAYEALAAGLPVITTPNTGTVVRSCREGYVLPIRNSEAIVEAIETLAEDHSLRAEMSRNARLRAGQFTLRDYGRRLRAALAEGLGDRGERFRQEPQSRH